MNYNQDLPLGKEPSSRLVPWIVAFMVYLGCLLAGATFYITGQAREWKSQLGSTLTIEVPISGKLTRAGAQERVLLIVNKLQGVKSAEALSEDQIESLLKRWVPDNTAEVALPLIVDVRLEDRANIDISHLEAMLKTITPQANVVDHRAWAQEVKDVIFIVNLIAAMLFSLLVVAVALITIFATRTSLLIHRQIIDVLHLIGATPTYISRQFDAHSLKTGLIAGLVGTILSALSFVGLYYILQNCDVGIYLSSSLLQNLGILYLIVPFLVAGLMMLTARSTVHKTLASGAY